MRRFWLKSAPQEFARAAVCAKEICNPMQVQKKPVFRFTGTVACAKDHNSEQNGDAKKRHYSRPKTTRNAEMKKA
jgi:hypothetical protein